MLAVTHTDRQAPTRPPTKPQLARLTLHTARPGPFGPPTAFTNGIRLQYGKQPAYTCPALDRPQLVRVVHGVVRDPVRRLPDVAWGSTSLDEHARVLGASAEEAGRGRVLRVAHLLSDLTAPLPAHREVISSDLVRPPDAVKAYGDLPLVLHFEVAVLARWQRGRRRRRRSRRNRRTRRRRRTWRRRRVRRLQRRAERA